MKPTTKNNNDIKFPEFGGFVTSPNIFNKKTGKPDPFGIISEQIFGPSTSYRCACGYLKHKTLDYGQTCPKCGVKCISNESRLKTFGKIKTIVPFIKYIHKKDIIKIISKKHKQLLDPKQCDANLALTRYICLKNDKSEILIINDISSCPSNFILIPFKITGLFSLIFIFRYLSYILNVSFIKEIFNNNYINDIIDVLPVDTRPVFKDKRKPNSLFFEEINKFYISLLNSNKRNKLLEPVIDEDMATWAEEITNKLKNKDFTPLDVNLLEYEQIAAFTQYYTDLIYEWCFEKIRGKEGIIRSTVLSRTLEFSARTVVSVDPSIKPYELKVPRPTLFSLWMPYFLFYITTYKKYFPTDEAYYKIAIKKYSEIIENKYIHDLFIEFLDWFCNDEFNKTEISYKNITEKLNLRQLSWWNRQPSK